MTLQIVEDRLAADRLGQSVGRFLEGRRLGRAQRHGSGSTRLTPAAGSQRGTGDSANVIRWLLGPSARIGAR